MIEKLGTVLIAGAGPAGMMAALELSRFGIPVRLIEKTSEPATTSRAVTLQPRTLELFKQRGLVDGLIAKGNKVVAVSVYGNGARVFRLSFEGVDSEYKFELLVSQAITEQILRDGLEKAGVPIERSTTMVAFSQTERETSVTAILVRPDGSVEQFPCDYLIDGEGTHSIARSTLGLNFEGKSLEEGYALGDLHIDGPIPEGDLNIFSSEHGFMGLFPMGNQRFRLIASNPLSTPSKDTVPSIEELQQIYDQRSHIPARFHDMTWSSWFKINSRMVDRMNVGRVFLGGDSSHIHSPAGGQGMNTGIQDMVNLSWKLAMVMKGQAKSEILTTYTEDRVPVIKTVLTKTEGLTHAIGAENHLFRSVFNHIAPWIVNTEFVEHNSTERMCQLSLNYRDSSLSSAAGHAGDLHAGDRVPEMPVMLLNREGSTDQSPQATSLFALMDPSVFTLLYSNINDSARTHTAVHGAVGTFHEVIRGHQIGPAHGHEAAFKKYFGSTSSVVMVRPDGYIAFTGTEHSIPNLAKYCQQWLIAQDMPLIREKSDA